jgi:hypothetical protein
MMCMLPSEREQLEKLAASTTDPLLQNAILLLLRGESLPPAVVTRLLNAGASLLDAHDMAIRMLGKAV